MSIPIANCQWPKLPTTFPSVVKSQKTYHNANACIAGVVNFQKNHTKKLGLLINLLCTIYWQKKKKKTKDMIKNLLKCSWSSWKLQWGLQLACSGSWAPELTRASITSQKQRGFLHFQWLLQELSPWSWHFDVWKTLLSHFLSQERDLILWLAALLSPCIM